MRVHERVVGTIPHTPSLAIFSHDSGKGRFVLWGPLGRALYQIFHMLAVGLPFYKIHYLLFIASYHFKICKYKSLHKKIGLVQRS